MVFSSLTFLFLFFPLVMGVYYLCPRAQVIHPHHKGEKQEQKGKAAEYHRNSLQAGKGRGGLVSATLGILRHSRGKSLPSPKGWQVSYLTV